MWDGTNLSVTVPPLLPTDGQTLYVTLWSRIYGVWYYTFYQYRAATITGKAAIVTPASGSTLSSSNATFVWNPAVNGSWYDLYVGRVSEAARGRLEPLKARAARMLERLSGR